MMSGLKRVYWKLLRRLRPTHAVLSPHDALDAMARRVGGLGRRIVVFDGGAHDGAVARRMAHRFGDVELHAFEPDADLLATLDRALRGLPGTVNACALAERSGAMTLNVNRSPMTNSLLQRGELAERYFDGVTRPRERRQVRVVSIDDFCRDEGVERIDVLKLDLQGYELHALCGAREMLRRGIACVYVEVSFGEVYRGGAVFAEIDAALRQAGYELVNLYHLSTRREDGRLLGGDALYVPRATADADDGRRAA